MSHHSQLLSPLVVKAVRIASENNNVDLRRIKIVKKLGGTLDDCKLVQGVAFTKRPEGLQYIKDCKIGLIQFCIAPPKTDMDASIIVSDD